MTLKVNGREEQSVLNVSGLTEPEPCDIGRLIAQIRGRYTVPANPPPVIMFEVDAVDFMGRRGEHSIERAFFPTTGRWEGSYTGRATWTNCGGLPSDYTSLDGTFVITANADGTATLVADHTATGSCAGPAIGQTHNVLTHQGAVSDTALTFERFLLLDSTLTLKIYGPVIRGRFYATVQNGVGIVDLDVRGRCAECPQ
jgi:hypothetical protein